MHTRILLAIPIVLAGCAGTPGGPASDPSVSSAATPQGSNSTAEAPQWLVGQSWEHNWEFKDPTIGAFDVKSVVARDEGTRWLLGVPDAETAAFHAAFFFPDLGTFQKDDLEASAGEFVYPWYSFPLEDGKTWTATERNIDASGQPQQNEVDFVAHLTPKPDGAARFVIRSTMDGNLRAIYDYDPAYQWFSVYRYYNATPLAVEDDPTITIESSVPSYGFSGEVYVSTGELLLGVASQFGALADPDPSHAQPQGTFTPAAEHDHLLVIIYNFAVCGAQTTHLVPPVVPGGAFTQYPYLDVDGPACADMGQGTGSGSNLYIASVPGEWRFVTVGAAVIISGGGIFAYGITEVVVSVSPAPAPVAVPEA